MPSTLRLPRFAGPASALAGGGGGGGGGAEDSVLLVGPPAFPDAALVTFWPTSLLAGWAHTQTGTHVVDTRERRLVVRALFCFYGRSKEKLKHLLSVNSRLYVDGGCVVDACFRTMQAFRKKQAQERYLHATSKQHERHPGAAFLLLASDQARVSRLN